MQFTIMPRGGNIDRDTDPGHYLDLRDSTAQVVVVDAFLGWDAYREALPEMHPCYMAEMIKFAPDDEREIFCIYFVRDGNSALEAAWITKLQQHHEQGLGDGVSAELPSSSVP